MIVFALPAEPIAEQMTFVRVSFPVSRAPAFHRRGNVGCERLGMALREAPSGRNWRNDTLSKAVDERGGTTPFNLIPISTGYQHGSGGHPAVTPYNLAAWWCRYILPQSGVLLDPFCGSGTMLLAGLNQGASKVIGIEKEAKYLKTERKRIVAAGER